MLGSPAPAFVIEAFQAADLVPALKLAQRSLGEEIPYEFFLKMSTLRPEYCKVARNPVTGAVLGLIVGTREPGFQGRVLVFAVDPSMQGRGVGRALMRSLQQAMTLEDVRQVELEVRADNASAIEFYTRHGFEFKGIQAAAYRDGMDAFVLSKPLW